MDGSGGPEVQSFLPDSLLVNVSVLSSVLENGVVTSELCIVFLARSVRLLVVGGTMRLL